VGPFLILVLAGFALFMGVFGTVSIQDYVRRARLARAASKGTSEDVPYRSAS